MVRSVTRSVSGTGAAGVLNWRPLIRSGCQPAGCPTVGDGTSGATFPRSRRHRRARACAGRCDSRGVSVRSRSLSGVARNRSLRSCSLGHIAERAWSWQFVPQIGRRGFASHACTRSLGIAYPGLADLTSRKAMPRRSNSIRTVSRREREWDQRA
jgi:hypothetical protein